MGKLNKLKKVIKNEKTLFASNANHLCAELAELNREAEEPGSNFGSRFA